ncbi:MAG TPA: hypothetical protein DCG49_06095 [Ruminococcus sp.]|nr:hypothetical protein [Ruminococcus sp.]
MNGKCVLPMLAAFVISVSLPGCDARDWFAQKDANSQTEGESVPQFEVAAVKELVVTWQNDWNIPDREDEAQETLDALLNAVDASYAMYARAELAYYADWENTERFSEKNQAYENYRTVEEMASWAIENSSKKSEYPDVFSPYTDPDNTNYYLYNTLNKVVTNAKTDAAESTDLLNTYYDKAFDKDLDPDKTNQACAKLYLRTLEEYDTEQYLYDLYARDYTVEQASGLYQAVKEQLVPLYQEMYDWLTDDNNSNRESSSARKVDAYALLKEYAPQLSAPIAESAEKLFAEDLYVAAKGAHCYDGSYTVLLPNENNALMYTYLSGDFYDLVTVSHEFGHFHSDWRDSTPIFMQENCMDLAEVQSQCMEMLFTSFYDEIFEEDADYLELTEIYNILDSVISGLAIGEFEYEVMQQLDTITPDAVLALYRQIADECGLTVQLYQITHLFEQPGYYISYGISALPALDYYTILQEDEQKARALYDQISSLSSVSGEYRFCSAMQACGMRDYFAAHALDEIVSKLEERFAALSRGEAAEQDAA